MKIVFVRSGGFGGLRLETSLDTGEIDPEEAARVEALVAGAGFFNLPERSVGEPISADRFQYRIAISQHAGHAHTVVAAEDAMPDRARPLLDYLTTLALRGPRTADEPKPSS